MLHSLCYALDVLFIVTKSSLFTVGRLCDKTIDSLGAYIHIENANICWGKSLKYLGIYFQSDYSIKCAVDSSVRRFYTAANAIVSQINQIKYI